MDFSINNLDPGDEIAIQQTAGVLVAAFPKHPAWSHMENGLKEVVPLALPAGRQPGGAGQNGHHPGLDWGCSNL